jgi:hypothetical protein
MTRDLSTYLPVGARVKLRRDSEYPYGPWPNEPIGTAVEHPLGIEGRSWREVSTPVGTRCLYWIVFDLPQLDADGDGPYHAGEVLDKYVVALAG